MSRTSSFNALVPEPSSQPVFGATPKGNSRTASTPNVSLVDLVATVDKTGITVSDVNEALKQASEESLAGFLGYSETPLVSIDFNGSSLSSVVDAPITYVIEDMVKVLSWYDNESGYSHRMVDLAAMVGKEL